MRPHISYSEWMLYRNNCQWRWKLDYLDGLRSAVFGVHLDFGTAIHEALEKYKTKKDAFTVEQTVVHFKTLFLELFKENSDKYEGDPVSEEEFILAGTKIITDLHKCEELNSAEVMFNEFELLLPIDRLDGVEIKFKGFIDIVLKTKDARGNPVIYIADFKTCSWGWPLKKKTDKDLQHQIFLYKHFFCKKWDLDPKNVRVAFILLKRTPKNSETVEFFKVSAGPVSVQRSLDELNSDITDMNKRMKDSSFVKNRDSCVNNFGQTCPYLNTDKCPSN